MRQLNPIVHNDNVDIQYLPPPLPKGGNWCGVGVGECGKILPCHSTAFPGVSPPPRPPPILHPYHLSHIPLVILIIHPYKFCSLSYCSHTLIDPPCPTLLYNCCSLSYRSLIDPPYLPPPLILLPDPLFPTPSRTLINIQRYNCCSLSFLIPPPHDLSSFLVIFLHHLSFLPTLYNLPDFFIILLLFFPIKRVHIFYFSTIFFIY